MLFHIAAIQRTLVEQYGFAAGPNGCPQNVPDGEYPMNIDGVDELIRIVGGKIRIVRERGRGE